ncbi:cation transport protein-domain-containing protein [Crassisporium funariophilum]|nr:cation transport protein-domain-containing protein [Crassisporium funariophilum]
MTSLLSDLPAVRLDDIWHLRKHLNFYRTHILVFTFTPLIFSGIFYASNGQYKISYIDSLFNCVSAMTVCGLATVNLSSLTGWQQTILFIQMCMGNPVVVSWVMVFIRRYFFARKFQYILEAAAAKKAARLLARETKEGKPWPNRIAALVTGRNMDVVGEDDLEDEMQKDKGSGTRKVRTSMIRRMDDAPMLVNPSGWVSEGRPPSIRKMTFLSPRLENNKRSLSVTTSSTQDPLPHNPVRRSASVDLSNTSSRRRRLSDPGHPSRPTSPISTPMHRFETVAEATPSPSGSPKRFARAQTVEFAPAPRRRGRMSAVGPIREEPQSMLSPELRSIRSRRPSIGAPNSVHTNATGHTHHSHKSLDQLHQRRKNRGFGGFPMPYTIIGELFSKLFPNMGRKLTRTVTIPVTTSLNPIPGNKKEPGVIYAPYLSFETTVGPNSAFNDLTREQREELGGAEYRGLNILLWIVPAYHFCVQLIAFVVIAPYISRKRWKSNFEVPQQLRNLHVVWFAAFQVVSAYTNTGTSLVDQSMLPFQKAYPMITVMIILILAGNTCFPIFLRFTIWFIAQVVPQSSRTHETLRFLLDHPRRCFIYLFPSHQTWFLLTIVVSLTAIDWFFFLILDIDNATLEQLPVGVRVLNGFLQAVAVRAAGFGAVPLAALAPAVKVLYVVTMYISVYPIAMSVRSTNVYEEQSLGVFHDEDEDENDESGFVAAGNRINVWSRYLAMHARRQLAFDMWWLALALFFTCIIERRGLENAADFGWFNIFTILFELVSAYGTVGLSLGIPTQNYSLVGSFRPLSKLIVCLVMLRGRHRGLPVAIDRAVMVPVEFREDETDEAASEDGPLQPEKAPSVAQVSGPVKTQSQQFRHSETMTSQRRLSTKRVIPDDVYNAAENGQS